MTKPLYRIAMVSPGPFPGPRGSQVLVRELAESLTALGHTVHLIAYGAGNESPAGSRLHVHRTPAFLGGSSVFGPHPWRLVLNLFLLCTLYRVVRAHGVHVIHAHNYEAPILAYVIRALLGTPVVYHAHNLLGDELALYFRGPRRRRLAALFGGLLDRLVPRRADGVVALSEVMAEGLRDSGVAAERLEVVPPGVHALAGRRPWHEPEPMRKSVVYAGNLDPYQDIAVLIEAIATARREDPEIQLDVVTHWPSAQLDRRVRELGLEQAVRIRVVHSYERVQALLSQADLLVCPRSSWSGFPIKLLNYMNAGGLMIVAAGAAKSLGAGPWIVVPDNDPDSLGAAIVTALRDPALRRRLGGEAQRIAQENYDWGRLAPRIEALYGRVLERTQMAA